MQRAGVCVAIWTDIPVPRCSGPALTCRGASILIFPAAVRQYCMSKKVPVVPDAQFELRLHVLFMVHLEHVLIFKLLTTFSHFYFRAFQSVQNHWMLLLRHGLKKQQAGKLWQYVLWEINNLWTFKYQAVLKMLKFTFIDNFDFTGRFSRCGCCCWESAYGPAQLSLRHILMRQHSSGLYGHVLAAKVGDEHKKQTKHNNAIVSS